MTRYHLKNNNVRVPFTAEEETARDEAEAQWLIDNQAFNEAETARLEKKASGKQKLKDLGLDDEEIKVLTGA